MTESIIKEKILLKLNSEKVGVRKRIIKKIPLKHDVEIIKKLILIIQIDEKESVRKEAYNLLAKIPINDKEIQAQIIKILESSSINEPKEHMRLIAAKALQKRKK
ncbi:MAG: hypothetical protein ACFFDW_15260 [Candidatus Thorarchaeota archaeon]